MAASSCTLLFLMMIIIIFPVSITAQQSSNRNVTPGSSIIAGDATPTTWTSPSGEFAFGFQQVAPGAFLLAIWFDQLPQKTIVWSANRDDPVPAGSTAQLSADGTLELTDQTTRQVWAKRSGSAYAAMLDTGNFVLATNTSTILWQSFGEPTDTLLPSQILNQGGVLVSSFSETNYSRGKFKLAMQTDGDLVLWTRSFPFDDNIDAYWSSRTYETDSRLIFNTSGNVYLIQSNGTVLDPDFFFENNSPVGQFHQRLKLEYDGVIRHYVFPKSPNPSSSSSWSVFDFEPENICLHIGEEHTGGGACGFNSICTNGAADGRPTCSCPRGYSSRGGLNGCGPDFAPHRCDQLQSQDAQHFTFELLSNTDWPLGNYAKFHNVDEEWCRQSCLADCYCAVAIYIKRICIKKPLPFINGRVDSAYDGKTFVKVRKNNITYPFFSGTRGNSSTTLIIILSVLLGCSLLLFLLLFIFRLNHRKPYMMVGVGTESNTARRPVGVNTISSFSFDELQEATNGFKEELGMGAFSTVYRGALTHTGEVVAVKKLHKIAKEADLEFIAEVSSISRTNHKNLVQLLGYCNEGQNRILVYEFMTNGSLATFLFEKTHKPAWHTRVQIAFAIARGLCYLHEECSAPIIHCDIKPQNVLLEESYTPKIADFGLAKLMKPDQTRTMTGIRGTRGYVAPEWFRSMPITAKVDVYSFGILLLELLCCRKHYEADLEDDGEAVLADWAYDCYQQGELDMLVRGDEEARSDMKTLEIFVKTAMWCIQEDPTLRPHMKMVMHMLEGLNHVPSPPDPTTIIIA